MVVCPYCNSEAMFVKGDKIYPNRPDLFGLNFWYCDNGHEAAYVGCHKTNTRLLLTGAEPLGRLADKELRLWKSNAHAVFDPLWKNGKFKSRRRAYNWLADKMKIDVKDAHIGMFDVEQCKRVVQLCKEFKK